MSALTGNVVILSGADAPVGRGIALQLARSGADLVLCGGSATGHGDGPPMSDLAAEVAGEGRSAVVADEDDTTDAFAASQAAVNLAIRTYGRLDGVVSHVAGPAGRGLLSVDEAEWAATCRRLARHAGLVKAAVRQMMAAGNGGRVVTVSGLNAFFGTALADAAAKAAVMGMTASLARELADHGITVNCVVLDDAAAGNVGGHRRAAAGLPGSATGLTESESIAPLVCHLCSPASSATSGRFIYASGCDLAVYTNPLMLRDSSVFMRSVDGWNVSDVKTALGALFDGN